MANARKERVAVLEWKRRDDIEKMLSFCQSKRTILGVDYYTNAGIEEFAMCMNQEYSRILVDFGNETSDKLNECSRCDRKLLIGSLSEWRAQEMLTCLKQRKNQDDSWNVATTFGSEETKALLEKHVFRPIHRIPFSADPFVITRSDIDFFGLIQ